MVATHTSGTLHEFCSRSLVISRRYRKQGWRYRATGFIVMAIWAALLLSMGIKSPAEAIVSDWIDLVCFVGAQVVLAIVVVLLMTTAEEKDGNARSAELVGSICKVFESELPYILMLRSFDSQLVSEVIDRVTVVEREAVRMVRGEPVPSGRKYKDYVRERVQVDAVTLFLLVPELGLHVVIINNDPENITLAPLSVVSTEKQWWSVFEILSEGARLVVTVPETSASLIEEIRSVLAFHPEKAVFVMPPSMQDPGVGERTWLSGMTRRSRWEEIREQFPVKLPDYCENGALLQFPSLDSLPVSRSYSEEAVKELVMLHPGRGVSIAAALAQLERRELLKPMIDELERRAARLM